MDVEPFITVIVPVRNEAERIAATLKPVLAQDYPAFEVLVIDGRSTDDTRSIVRGLQTDHDRLHLLDNPKRWSSAARNVGIDRAAGEIVLVIDGHCEVKRADYLRRLAAAFADPRVDCVGRPQPLDVTGATSLQRAIAAARSSKFGHNPGSYIYSDAAGFVPPQSVAVAYRKAVFDRVGCFDETFDACEDVELNTRVAAAGMSCYFDPSLAVHYHPRSTLAGLAFQLARYGRGRVRLMRKHPNTIALPPLVPAAFLLSMAATFLLGLTAPPIAAIFCTLALLYAAAVLAASVACARSAPELLPWLPAVFAVIHVGAGCGVIAESFRPLRPITRTIPALLRSAALRVVGP